MKYYIIHDNAIYSESNNLEQIVRDVKQMVEANSYSEAQVLEYIQIIKGEELNFRVIPESLRIEVFT